MQEKGDREGWLWLTTSSGGGEVPLEGWPGQLSRCQPRLQTHLLFKTTLPCFSHCLHTQESTWRCWMRCFACAARASGCPEDRNSLWTTTRQDQVARTKQGLHENKAGSEEMSSCRHSISFARGNLPLRLGPACLVEYPGTEMFSRNSLPLPRDLKRAQKEAVSQAAEPGGCSFPGICVLKSQGWVL